MYNNNYLLNISIYYYYLLLLAIERKFQKKSYVFDKK